MIKTCGILAGDPHEMIKRCGILAIPPHRRQKKSAACLHRRRLGWGGIS